MELTASVSTQSTAQSLGGKPKNLRLLIPPNYTNPTELMRPPLSRKPLTNGPMPDISNPDLKAVAELLATFKQTSIALHSSINSLEQQTEKITRFAPAIKAGEQVAEARRKLREQVARHENMVQNLQILLKTMVQDRLFEHLKSLLMEQVKDLISERVKSRVQQALSEHAKGIERFAQTEVSPGEYSELSSPNTRFTKPRLCLMPSAAQSPAYAGPLSSSSTIVSAIPRSAFPTSESEMTSLTIHLPRGYTQAIRSISVTPSSPNHPTIHYTMRPKTPSALRRSSSQGVQRTSLVTPGARKQDGRRVNFLLQSAGTPESSQDQPGTSPGYLSTQAKTPVLLITDTSGASLSAPQSAMAPSPSPLPTLIRGFCDYL